ncbi:MAG: 16S rRNA (cytidine(1402)-2'-O)-methyltransferase [Solirubrobacteraceae bacterium]
MERNHAPGGEIVVCPTPIGNLEDVTLRALEALRTADVIACEDTRRTGQLLARHGLREGGGRLVSFHEHNEREQAAALVRQALAGARIALVSDAGTPLVSDPGFALLAAAREAGVAVSVLPGPSAVIAALVASGLPAQRFRFEGFLPRARGELERCLAGNEVTLVAFESPRRLLTTLALLAELDRAREVAVCRELTKLHEEVARGSAAELARRFAAVEPRGEIVLVVAPAAAQRADAEQAANALRELIEAGARARPAARALARLTNVSANELYELAMQDADSLRSQ